MDRHPSPHATMAIIAALVITALLWAPSVGQGSWHVGLEVASVRLSVAYRPDPVRFRTPLSEIGRSLARLAGGR